MNLTRILDAESEVLSLNDVKDHLRILGDDDNYALQQYITAVRHRAETYLGKTLVKSTWELRLDSFSDEIQLLMPPVTAIDSLEYVATDGTLTPLASYQFDRGGRLSPAYGEAWPATRDQYDAVIINYAAGYDHAGNIPEDIRLAMLLWIGACDINREDNIIGTIIAEIPGSAAQLLHPHRVIQL